MSVWAVLAAAGSGERLGADRPKAFVRLGEQPLLAESLARLDASGTSWSVAIPTPAVGKHTIYAESTQGFDTSAPASQTFTVTK